MKTKTMLSEEALKAMYSAEEETAPVVQAEAETPEVAATENDEVKFDAYQKDFEEYKTEAEGKLAASATEIERLKDELGKSQASSGDLKDIVIAQVSRMRLALKMPAVDMTSFSTESIVAEFNTTKDSFMKALPVGSVIPEKKEEMREAKVINSSVDASEFESLGFK